jgi:hypothetical protein
MMIFRASKRSIDAIFCDFSSSWHPRPEVFDRHGFKWPEDFEDAENVGQTRFQVIEDLKGGLSLYNYEGNLHPFTEKKIIERRCRVKENVIIERFGNQNPFRESNVFFLETGYNLGNVEFMAFNYHKNHSSVTSFREVLYKFPLSALTQIVLPLREQHSKGVSRLIDLEKRENKEILGHQGFKHWQLMKRDTSPSEDEYKEKRELPLHYYHFRNSEEIDVWLRFEFFEG